MTTKRNEIEKNLKEYGQNRNIEGLQSYVQKLTTKQITSLISARINHMDAPQVWNYLLQGFTDSAESQEKRIEITQFLLNEILSAREISSGIVNAIITRLCLDLHRFPIKHLVDLVTTCVDAIHAGDHKNMSWKDLLPELMTILIKQETLIHNESEISGIDFKSQIINSLCLVRWPANIVTSLSTMFINMPLTKEEHLKVSNKLCHCMDTLDPPEIPPLVYQLLCLCVARNTMAPLFKLCSLFSKRLYKTLQTTDSESIDIDSIEDSSEQDFIKAEATVLYHIKSLAMSSNNAPIKDFLNTLKNINKSPEFILRPFPLLVLLSVASLSAFEQTVYDVIKVAISRIINNKNYRKNSAWMRDLIHDSGNINEVFLKVIDCSANDRSVATEGLIGLGFHLLRVPGNGASNIWSIGIMILVKLCKKQRKVAPVVLQQLCDSIITEQNLVQFTECLYQMAVNVPMILVEHQSIIQQLLAHLLQAPGPVSKRIVTSIMPLIKLSPTIRDALILVLRKAIFSRHCSTRQMAVHGLCSLLRTLQLGYQNSASFSQPSLNSSWSGPSILTQMSLDVHRNVGQHGRTGTYEPLCLELLGVLRRGLMQQSEVRSQMYEGLYEAICKNPPLCSTLLEALLTHFDQFYISDGESLPPIKFESVVIIKENSALLIEPIGSLILLISRIEGKMEQVEDLSCTVSRNKTKSNDMLMSLCKRMGKCDLFHFGLDDGIINITDVIPECQQKAFIIKEILQVLESLMIYNILYWSLQAEEDGGRKPGSTILSLFNTYSIFLNYTKTITKSKKDAKKKKSDKNTSSELTQSGKTQMGSKPIPFKAPSTIFDYTTLIKILQLLHNESVPWSSIEQANCLKSKREFHRYILQNLISVVHNLCTVKSIEFQHGKHTFENTCTAGSVIYNRCIVRLNDVIEYDEPSAILAVEAMKEIINLICLHYNSKMEAFFIKMCPTSSEKTLGLLLLRVLDSYKEHLEKCFSSENEFGLEDDGKLSISLMQTVSMLCDSLPQNDTISNQVFDWIKSIAVQYDCNNKQLANVLHNVMFTLHAKIKITSSLYENAANQICQLIGPIDEEQVECSAPLKTISDLTMESVLQSLCSFCKTQIDQIDWIIQSLRADHAILLQYIGNLEADRNKEKLKEKERSLCSQFSLTIKLLAILSKIKVPNGPCGEGLLRVLSHLYTSMGNLTKYFAARSSRTNPVYENARFERVVKLAGKELCKIIYDLLSHMEEVQSSKNKVKLLREARGIPKLLYAIETFKKYVVMLSNKTQSSTKVQLISCINIGTSRDFRIKRQVLKDTLDNLPRENADDDISEEAAIENDDENDVIDQEQIEESPPVQPLRKRLRRN